MTSSLGLWLLACLAAPAVPTMDWLLPAGARRGSTVELTAGGKFDQWPVRVWCSNPGVTLKPLVVKGKFEVKVGPEAVPGPCLIRCIDDTGAGNSRPFILGNLPESLAREPDDQPASALPVGLPAVINGRLEKSGDVDCFAVELKAGQTFVASVLANRLLGSPMDMVLQLVSADGFVLTQNNDRGGIDPTLIHKVVRTGTFYVRLFAFSYPPDSSVRFSGGENHVYRLTVTCGAFARHAWPLALGPAGVGPKAGGLSARGYNLADTAATGRLVASNPSGLGLVGADSWANTVPVYLADRQPVVGASVGQPFEAPLWLSAEAGARGVAPTSVTVTLKGGLQYRLEAWSYSLGLSMFPSVRVIDPAGKVLQTKEPDDLDQDVDIIFKVLTDGNHKLEVIDPHGLTGDLRVCLVRLGRVMPAFIAKLGAEAVSGEPGKAATLPVTITRVGGLAGNAVFRLEGMPAGVPWVAEPDKKDPAKPVMLQIGPSSEPKAFSGPVRIFAKVADLPEKLAWTGSVYPGLQVETVWMQLPAAQAPGKPMEKPPIPDPAKKK